MHGGIPLLRMTSKPIYLFLLASFVSTSAAAIDKKGIKNLAFNVACNLSKSLEDQDDKWRFFYSIDITQSSQPKDIAAVVTYTLSGPTNLVSALNEVLRSTGSDATWVRSGPAEFSHYEGALEFLTERSLKVQLGIGIVLLQGKKIIGQCIKFTN
jgi:hypothetical protein